MPRSPVTVVIPVWNQWAYTRRCLETLRPTLGPRDHVVVVDNGSTDATRAGLIRFGWVEVITNADNRGFAAACNQGAAVAGPMSTDVVVFLNNDTLLPPRWLDELVGPFADDGVGATGPRSNGVSGPQLVESAVYDPADRKSLWTFARQWRQRHAGQVSPLQRLVGFALAVRRRAFDDIGGFDESFGIGGCEDDDLCRRLLQADWKLLVAHGSYVHHFGHATFDGNGVDWFELQEANAGRYEVKHGVPIGTATTRLSACMIVRDEEEMLPACLGSLAGIVDEVVVYDTGSSDQTVALARSAGATVIEGYWDDDFARARNAALAHCRGEWIFHIDADEVLRADRARLVGSLAGAGSEIDVVTVEIVNLRGDGTGGLGQSDSQRALRLFRRDRVQWRERLHEQLDLRPGQPGPLGAAFLADVQLIHSGYLDEVVRRRDKWNRNLRVALEAFGDASQPESGRNQAEAELSLARALTDVGRLDEAVEHLYSATTSMTSPVGLRFALTYGIHVLLNLGRNTEALEWAGRLRPLSSRSDLVDFLEGTARLQAGQPEGALACYARVSDLVDEDGFRPPGGTLERHRARALGAAGRYGDAADEWLGILRGGVDGEALVAASEALEHAGRPPAQLAAVIGAEQLTGVAALLVNIDPVVADRIADALWDRFALQPSLLAAAALFGPRIPALRALRWSARLREANSAQHCPLVARARDITVDPLERARSAALAGAGFGDPRSASLLDGVMPLVGESDLPKFVGDLSQLAPGLMAGAVLDAATDDRRRRLVVDVCEEHGLVDLTAILRQARATAS